MRIRSVFPPSSTVRFFEELLSLDDMAGAKSIVLKSLERVASLPFPEGQFDIDTWEDRERLDAARFQRTDVGEQR
jgi:hypothetical protein